MPFVSPEKKKKKQEKKVKKKKKNIHQMMQLLMACSKFCFNLICCMVHCLIHYKCSIVFASPCRTTGLKQKQKKKKMRDAPILLQSVKPWPVWFPYPNNRGYAKYIECVVSPQQIKRLTLTYRLLELKRSKLAQGKWYGSYRNNTQQLIAGLRCHLCHFGYMSDKIGGKILKIAEIS